jgi:5-formyltetrahydrofolate cyclo-ligase
MVEHAGDQPPWQMVRKTAMRASIRRLRSALTPAERASAAERITGHLDGLPELDGVVRLLAYAATPAEVDLDGWLRTRLARGSEVFLPWVEGSRLRLGRVADLDELLPGWRGLREPPHVLGDMGTDPRAMEAVVVPGLAFDSTGVRLGQGGGHYDRLLGSLRPEVPVIGVAYAVQVVGSLPREPHDRRVALVVTEEGVLRP